MIGFMNGKQIDYCWICNGSIPYYRDELCAHKLVMHIISLPLLDNNRTCYYYFHGAATSISILH